MKTLTRMFIWKYMGTSCINEAEIAYKWVMEAPIHKRLIRLWCIKHRAYKSYETLLGWVTKT